MKSITSKPTLKAVRRRALAMLSRRDHSIAEVKKKLRLKHHPEDLITQVIDQLVDNNLLDDEKFASNWGRFRTELCYHGPVRLKREFQEKGLPDYIISNALFEIEQHDVWAKVAKIALMKRYNPGHDLQAIRTRQKAFDYLKRLGHTSETILKLFRDLERQPEGVILQHEF